MFVFTRQFDLHEQIDRPPDRVEQTRKREVEESEPVVEVVAAMNRLIHL